MPLLDKAENAAKIFSLVAIPIILAIGGWVVQQRLAESASQQEFVKMAINILNAKPDKETLFLRDWAVDLLNAYSPVKLNPKAAKALRSGEALLPGAAAFSPDGTRIMTRDSNGVTRIWDLKTGQQLMELRESNK
jgi:hypothetical protein